MVREQWSPAPLLGIVRLTLSYRDVSHMGPPVLPNQTVTGHMTLSKESCSSSVGRCTLNGMLGSLSSSERGEAHMTSSILSNRKVLGSRTLSDQGVAHMGLIYPVRSEYIISRDHGTTILFRIFFLKKKVLEK